jgi:hypothetical protein
MVRNISVSKAKTLCYPGAWAQDITRMLPTLLPQMLGADTVALHVGSNDIRRASSEHLKIDFKELILALKDKKRTPIISGPVPSFGCGYERFRRLLCQHSEDCWHYTSG